MSRRARWILAAALAVQLTAAASAEPVHPDTTWPSLRGGPEGRAACRWSPDVPSPAVDEWVFASLKGSRRYRPGLATWASAAIAVVDGRPMAFIGGHDQRVHALDLVAKEDRWSMITNGEIASAPAVAEVDGELVVFWGSADYYVYARTARDGRPLWSRALRERTNTMGPAEVSAPLTHEGVVYVTCFAYDRALARNDQSGALYAIEAATGRIVWQIEVSQGHVSSPVGAEVNGEFLVFLAARKGSLQAFDVSGTQPVRRWQYQMPHEVLGSPVVLTDAAWPMVFLGSKFGNLVALDAATGDEIWKQMAGAWIDNTACVGALGGEPVVFTGSHDYCVYAFRAADGERLWRSRLGGEVYSAPAFTEIDGRPMVVAAALDDHVYLLDGATGAIETSFATGDPIWGEVTKGETLWGSPAVLEAGAQTVAVIGAPSDKVFVLPLARPSRFQARVRSAAGLWWGLAVMAVVFLGVVVPLTVRNGGRQQRI